MHTNPCTRPWLREEANDESENGGGTLLSSVEDAQDEFKPSFDGIVNADGSFTEGWTAKAFGPEYNGPLSTTRTVADVDKLLRDNMAAARGRQLSWPDEKASPEQLAAVRKLTGAPENPQGYGELRPESIPAEKMVPQAEGR